MKQCYKPRIWKKRLEKWYLDVCKQYIYPIVYILCTHGGYINIRIVLQTQDLRVGQANEPCIRLT